MYGSDASVFIGEFDSTYEFNEIILCARVQGFLLLVLGVGSVVVVVGCVGVGIRRGGCCGCCRFCGLFVVIICVILHDEVSLVINIR